MQLPSAVAELEAEVRGSPGSAHIILKIRMRPHIYSRQSGGRRHIKAGVKPAQDGVNVRNDRFGRVRGEKNRKKFSFVGFGGRYLFRSGL